MIIRILEDNEKNRIRPLYEEVFDDSQYFLDYYFGSYIKKAINFVCESEGEIVGMATIHPKKLMVSDKKVKAGYVYAVATKPEYRGHGIMHKILSEIFAYALENNYEYLYLIPVNPQIYVGLDYKLMRQKKELVMDRSEIEAEILEGKCVFKVNEINIPDCLEFIAKLYENRVSCYYEKENFSEILERLSINKSGIYCIFDTICDKILGLAFIEMEEADKKVILDDLICHKDDEELCMKLVLNELDMEEIFYKINDIMFKEVHGSMEQLKNYSIYINDEV